MKAYNMCACILHIHCAYVSFGNHPTIRPVATAVANMSHDIPMMLLLLMMITMVAMVVLMQVMMMVVIRVMVVCGDDDDGDEHSRKSYQLAMT